MQVVQLQDIYNNTVFVEPDKIITALNSEEFEIYERKLSELEKLIALYEDLGGEYPITEASIEIVRPRTLTS